MHIAHREEIGKEGRREALRGTYAYRGFMGQRGAE